MKARLTAGVAVAGLALAGAAHAEAEAEAKSKRLTPMGGPRHALQVCGERHVVLVRTAGRRVSIDRGRGVVRVDRCEAGRWVRFAPVRLRARRRGALPSRAPGDYRVRRGRARAYYRVIPAASPPPPPASAPPAPAGVVDVPVRFKVVNRNRSRAACRTDGGEYEVRGHLIAPQSVVSRPGGRSVTLYLHSIGWTQASYWHFTAVPGYDYATEMARAGHASLVYDQIGYGTSGKPDPATVCYGGEADVASQIATQLRSGEAYGGPAFERIALASHSVMGLVTEPEAYSFKDIDALIVTAWADQGYSDRLRDTTTELETHCAQHGGYVEFTAERLKENYFANADPAVADAAVALRAPVPCGEPQSAFQTVGANVASLREVTVPVLLVYGRQDALFDQPAAGEDQAKLYSGTSDLTTEFIDGAGGALALERTAPQYRGIMSRWLAARGF